MVLTLNLKNKKLLKPSLSQQKVVFIVAALLAAIIVFYSHLVQKTVRPADISSAPVVVSDTDVLHQQLLAIENNIPTQAGKNNFLKQSNNLTQKVDLELVDLDSQIISCGANIDSLFSQSPTYGGSCRGSAGSLASIRGKYMGGQCCSALMDTKEYHENLEKLQAYKGMPNIPLDPMHTPIAMAKMWIEYDNATTLTPKEQKIYDQAYAISKEKPCCCKCWHYFVNEGIAKKMIKNKTFSAEQIATYWDDSDICGG